MPSKTHPALDHIEKTLTDAYRKEIDQEENIWRSLPFFAATIAFELASLFQLVERLPPTETVLGKSAIALLGLSAVSTLAALCFLAASIYPLRFDYLAPETELFNWTKPLSLLLRCSGKVSTCDLLGGSRQHRGLSTFSPLS